MRYKKRDTVNSGNSGGRKCEVPVSFSRFETCRYSPTSAKQRRSIVPVADCEPGAELQVDFGRLGLLTDAALAVGAKAGVRTSAAGCLPWRRLGW
jgi:hypothetical protein